MTNNPFVNNPNSFNSEPIRKDNGVSDTDLLKLMDILTLHEASALIAGVSPNKVSFYDGNNEGGYYLNVNIYDPANAQDVFSISLKAMIHAIKAGLLKANVAVNVFNGFSYQLTKESLQADWIATNGIDEAETTVAREDLKDWLEKRGVFPTMLFPNGKKDDYMNPQHDNYSPKLAVCVRAWEVAQNGIPHGKTTKQFIIDWITEHGKEYGLEVTGKSNIEHLATIPNWDITGGKVRTNLTPHNEPLNDQKEIAENLATVHQKLAVNLPSNTPAKADDDVPF